MVNLLFSGCDCVGKTSIINEIVKQDSKYIIIKRNAPKNKEEAKLLFESDVDFLNLNNNYIFDRGMFCENIYAPIFRDYKPEYMRDLENKLTDNTILILVTAKPEIVQKRFDGIFIKDSQIPKILENFDKEYDICNFKRKFKIDSSFNNPNNIAYDILQKIKEYKK